MMRLYRMQEDLAFLADSVAAVRDQARERAGKLGKSSLGRKVDELSQRLDTLSKTLASSHPPLEGQPADADRQLREWIDDLFGAINGFGGRPSAGQLAQIPVLEGRLASARRSYESLVAPLPGINRDLGGKSLAPIETPAREQWEKQQKS
jgi:hypothetical protein